MTTAAPRALRLGGRRYPIVLPSWRDPRLHVAAVIVSIHVLGQVALGFDVSVAQILVAIATCAVIEVVWTLRRTGQLVWPASALLTGSGVALIFRVFGTEHGDYWSLRDWHLFAAVAGASLLTKYLIRWRGSHLFNPSNVGLVVAFLLLGSSRAEPLDFWWAPFGLWMAAAYAIILVGGLAVTARLRLLGMAAGFWATLAAAIGVLSASGHCITARWAFEPVCGTHFWWVIVTSPEVLVFLFFMITDPKTVPAGRDARVLFGVGVAVVSALLIAPQRTEFGAKVALLGGLAVLTAARPVLDRLLPAAREAAVLRPAAPPAPLPAGEGLPGRRRPARVAAAVGIAAVVIAGLVVAGAPARQPARGEMPAAVPDLAVDIDPATLPAVTVDPDITRLDEGLGGPGGQRLAEALAAGLGTEAEALLRGDRALLLGADADLRLAEMEERFDRAAQTGLTTVAGYDFDSLHVVVTHPYGEQGGAAPGIEARGTQTDVTLDAGGREVERTSGPCAIRFSLRAAGEGRWLIVAATPLEA